MVQLSSTARILVVGQAPGTKVHLSGVPFADLSGARLRDWKGVSDAEFYDERFVAIAPMAFCYPGASAGGDAAPRSECARLWRARVMEQLVSVRLTLLVGAHAQDHTLGRGRMTDRVRLFETFLPRFFPLPHPSWRSRTWMDRNPWFEDEVLPRLRSETRLQLRGRSGAAPPPKTRRSTPGISFSAMATEERRMRRFEKGDHVSWNSEAGRVTGRIINVHKRDFDYKGHTHHASGDDPQYEIMSDKTEHVAAHKGNALTKIG